MPTYKISYFDIRGLGEVARQLLHLSGLPFEDDRIPEKDWETGKKRKKDMAFGQVPVLKVDGNPIVTSLAINRYLAKQFGFAGRTAVEAALVDALADQWMDYFEEERAFIKFIFENNFQVKPFLLVSNGISHGDVFTETMEEMRKRAERGMDKHLPMFERFAKEHGSAGHCVGTSLTWADLLLTDHFRSLRRYFPDALKEYATLDGLRRMAEEHPLLSNWRIEHNQPF